MACWRTHCLARRAAGGERASPVLNQRLLRAVALEEAVRRQSWGAVAALAGLIGQPPRCYLELEQPAVEGEAAWHPQQKAFQKTTRVWGQRGQDEADE